MMMMGLPLRSRYWSVLQVVAIVACLQGKVSSERVQGCVESELDLRCPETKVIRITAVVLGDSKCSRTACCIRDNDCTRSPNTNHVTDVQGTCEMRQSCTVRVIKEKISCGFLGFRLNNDFERITFDCINDPYRSTTTTAARPVSTEIVLRTEELITLEEETGNDETTTSTDVQNEEYPDEDIHHFDEDETSEAWVYDSESITVTSSEPDTTERIFHSEGNTPEKETVMDEDQLYNSRLTTSVYLRPASTEDIWRPEESIPEIDTEHGLTISSLSSPDSSEDNLHTEENTPEVKAENDGATSSIEEQHKGLPRKRIDGPHEKQTNEQPHDSHDAANLTEAHSKERFNAHQGKRPHDEESAKNSLMLPVGIATVCLLALIAIVVAVAMMRRKRWTKANITVEMEDIEGNVRNKSTLTEENQKLIPNHWSESLINNNKMENSRDDGAKASETCEAPNNVVNSLAVDAGTGPTEDASVDLESREPAYQVPRPNVYCVAKDVEEPNCAGSTADASNGDNSVHCNVETKEPAKAANNSDDMEIGHEQSLANDSTK